MKTHRLKIYRRLIEAAFCALAVLPGPAPAAEASFDHWERASDSELDQLRGGFVLPNGVNVDFSVARVSSMNGSVVASSFFQMPENVLLLQNGTMNLAADPAGNGLSTVIQNGADNQVIRTVTDINIGISNLRNMNLNSGGFAVSNLMLPGMH